MKYFQKKKLLFLIIQSFLNRENQEKQEKYKITADTKIKYC
jgi:hypothetical protein